MRKTLKKSKNKKRNKCGGEIQHFKSNLREGKKAKGRRCASARKCRRSAEVKSLGESLSLRASASLDSLSLSLLFQMWLTHPSQSLSPPENTALQALHVTRGPLQKFFFSFFFFLFSPAPPSLLPVVAYHLDYTKVHRIVWSILWYYCVNHKAFKNVSLQATGSGFIHKSIHYFTPKPNNLTFI